MDRATAQVLQGFMQLASHQRDEFVEGANKWLNGDIGEKRSLEASAHKVLSIDLGPMSSDRCPRCGR